MTHKLLYVAIALSAASLCAANPVSLITKCKLDDAECLKANAVAMTPVFAAGMPQYGVETLDPIFLEMVDASKLNLKFLVYNNTLRGLKDCKILDIHRSTNQPTGKLFLKISCAVEGEGQYELSGKVLALDINGRGVIHYMLRRFEMSLEMDVKEKVGKDSKSYWDVTKFKYTFDLMEKSDVTFDNLFEGNDALSHAAAEVIKNSGNDIVKEVGDPIFHATASKVIKNFNNFFSFIPIEDLCIL